MATRVQSRDEVGVATSGPRVLDALSLYLREIQKINVLPAAEERELGRRAQAGDAKAIDELVRHNLRFVVVVARRYSHHGVPLEDLIDEGNIGLIRAAERFDPERGFRFISYAVWWIRQAILQCLSEKSRIVRLPVSKVQILSRIAQTSERLTQALGREPTTDELGARLEVAPAKVEWLRTLPTVSFSLDEPAEGDETDFEADTLEDPHAAEFEDRFAERERNADLDRCLSQLDPRGADIVRRYFGIGHPASESLESIGHTYGVTRERVRQLRDRALGKLRSLPDCVALSDS